MSNDVLLSHIDAMAERLETLRRSVNNTPAKTDTAGNNNRKKLTPHDVDLMRKLHREGLTNRDIASVFDVNPATVNRTVRRIYWR